MTIKRFTANKDTTITRAFKSNLSSRATKANMGSSDVLEVYSIFGQASSASVEQSRVLVEFPVSDILEKRRSSEIPDEGSVKFRLKLYNARHGQTTPEDFYLTARPLLQSWEEGSGLDMDSYLDLGATNWTSASTNVNWNITGGTVPDPSRVLNSPISLEYVKFFDNGTSDLDIDITPIVEAWIKDENSQSAAASASIQFSDQVQHSDFLDLITYDNVLKRYMFSNAITSSYSVVGNTTFVGLGSNVTGSFNNFKAAVSSSFPVSADAGAAATCRAIFTQKTKGVFGSTIITGSAGSIHTISKPSGINHEGSTPSGRRIEYTHFSGGLGAKNYGLLVNLSGAYEDGTRLRSYYTKKFFARTSQFFFKKPIIEAQWDLSIKDDRGSVYKSSSLVPGKDNLNRLYLYNKNRSGFVDIPDTGNSIVVKLYDKITGNPEPLPFGGGVPSNGATFITASRVSTGIYQASFAYTGSKSTLVDIWNIVPRGYPENPNSLEQIFTGAPFAVNTRKLSNFYETPEYVTSISNLKQSYAKGESSNFRIYTRKKGWQPNIYTVASNTAPVNNVSHGFYKVRRVADNLTVIPYSTGSTPSFSSLSYDMSGSFFDLDMSILEPNYLYEISLLFKDGGQYIEQKEKFKFRVDP